MGGMDGWVGEALSPRMTPSPHTLPLSYLEPRQVWHVQLHPLAFVQLETACVGVRWVKWVGGSMPHTVSSRRPSHLRTNAVDAPRRRRVVPLVKALPCPLGAQGQALLGGLGEVLGEALHARADARQEGHDAGMKGRGGGWGSVCCCLFSCEPRSNARFCLLATPRPSLSVGWMGLVGWLGLVWWWWVWSRRPTEILRERLRQRRGGVCDALTQRAHSLSQQHTQWI